MPTGHDCAMRIEIRVPGLLTVEHTFRVPLDHANPGAGEIDVFAREVADPDGADRPFLVYFQGGPGFEATRPTGSPRDPQWLARALQDFRVLLLDQRGTGRSTPVGVLPGLSPQAQAGYLTHFRADSIVRDAELIRRELGVDRWSVLGQSFGGFCLLSYLSIAPEGPARSALHRWHPAGSSPDRRDLSTHLQASARPQRAVLPALSRRSRSGPADPRCDRRRRLGAARRNSRSPGGGRASSV